MTARRSPPVPDDLTPEQRKRLVAWLYAQGWGELYRSGEAKSLKFECLDHYRANGNRQGYSDWLAVVRNWIRKHMRFKAERAAHERPQMAGPREGEGSLGGHLEVILGGRK